MYWKLLIYKFYLTLGNEYYVSRNAWSSIKFKQDSVFIRELMLVLWTQEKLFHRCLDPKKAKPLKGDPPGVPVTPQKVKVILIKFILF